MRNSEFRYDKSGSEIKICLCLELHLKTFTNQSFAALFNFIFLAFLFGHPLLVPTRLASSAVSRIVGGRV